MKRLLGLMIAGLIGATLPGATRAQDVPVKFTLDWKAQGPHAWYYLAQRKGYFKAEGLDVTIDQGEGSAAAVTRIMSGAYDAGFGDINAIIQMAAKNPGLQPAMVYLLYNRAPYAIISRADGPVASLKDLEGRTIATPAGSATFQMFPALAGKNGVDAAKVKVSNAAPNLIETMLVQRQADAIAQFSATSYMNFVAMGLNPDKDFRWFFYSDLGLDMYSNGVMVSQKLLKEKPQVVRGLVKAVNRAILEVAAKPDEGIALLKTVDPLIDAEIEKKRLVYFLDNQMRTPETARLGLGDLDDGRLAASIATVAATYGLPSVPKPADVFDRAFLPPPADRMLSK